MTPIELLKNGLQSANWDLIQQAYQALTGDRSIDTPQATEIQTDYENMINQISAIINRQSQQPIQTIEETHTIDQEVGIQAVRKGKTVFITGEGDDISTNNNVPKRDRPVREVKLYTIECSECNKKFTSKKSAGELGTKCEECMRSKKRRNE